jgi:integrase/recombinase XerD
LPALIQRFFTDRLCVQMEASRHTIASYRDTFRLLLRYAGARLGKPPVAITVEDIDVDLVADFLAHTEAARGNCARSRNTRLAAIRSFFRYVAMTDPTWMLHCQRILAMPNKRYVKRAVTFLDASEIAALLAAPDRSTWVGKRDHALLLLAVQTGLRASELISLRNRDVVLGTGAHVRCMGKGRKERSTPIRRETAKILKAWIGDHGDSDLPMFPSIRGERLSRDALEHLVRKHCLTASRTCPSIGAKRVTPHTLRHSTAMNLLHHGVDQAVIALWLGHESVETTQVYIHADMHWTGHATRLGRDQTGSFGSKDYGREELVAEMAGAFVCAALGIVPSVRHADYIGSWLQIIREDNRAILRAASAASKAADYILACRDTASTGLDVASEDEADGFELEGRLAA